MPTENGATTISSDHDQQHLLKGLHVYSGAITVQAHVFFLLYKAQAAQKQ